MKQEKFLELINKKIDGLLTEKEQADLEKYLTEYPAAQSLYREYLQVSDILAHAGRENPPPELKKHIMNSIPTAKYKKTSKSLFHAIRDFWNFDYKHGVTFAVGVAAGLIFFFVVADLESQLNLTDSDLIGTIAPNQDMRDFSETGRSEFNAANLRGALICRRSRDLVTLDLQLTIDKPTTLAVQFDPADLRFAGVGNSTRSEFSLSVAVNTVEITLSESTEPLLLFEDQTDQASTITIRLLDEGSTVQKILSTGLSRKE